MDLKEYPTTTATKMTNLNRLNRYHHTNRIDMKIKLNPGKQRIIQKMRIRNRITTQSINTLIIIVLVFSCLSLKSIKTAILTSRINLLGRSLKNCSIEQVKWPKSTKDTISML